MRKIMWVCNIMLPDIAKAFSLPYSNREGWLSGIFQKVQEEEVPFALSVCFPVTNAQKEQLPAELFKGGITVGKVHCYGFSEDLSHPECYDAALETRFADIFSQNKPDVLHLFGTEFPHTLAAAKAFGKPEKTLIGIQGLCGEIAKVYLEGLPENVVHRATFRDVLRQDSLKQQKRKFEKRGIYEAEAIRLAGFITGRTAFDRNGTYAINSKAQYFSMNETMRSGFYEGQWNAEGCERHSLFLGQGDYPLKGFHVVLQAMPEILQKFPDTKLYVAGNNVTAHAGLKDRLKLSSYGKYLLSLIGQYHLEEQVILLGNLPADRMKEQFLKSHVFVCASILENSPNTIGEAMLLGVPVVASRVGGIPDMITDGADGLLFSAGAEQELADAVISLFADDALAMRLSAAAGARARIVHDPKTNYERLLTIYGEICGA